MEEHLSAAELAALASQCYGQRWQSALARDMEVNVRTVQRWAVDGITREKTAKSVRHFLTERRVATIPSPAPGLSEDERDDACYEALNPVITAVARAADDNGWHPAEVWVAILSMAAENILMMAGKAAAIQTLNEAIALVKDSEDNEGVSLRAPANSLPSVDPVMDNLTNALETFLKRKTQQEAAQYLSDILRHVQDGGFERLKKG